MLKSLRIMEASLLQPTGPAARRGRQSHSRPNAKAHRVLPAIRCCRHGEKALSLLRCRAIKSDPTPCRRHLIHRQQTKRAKHCETRPHSKAQTGSPRSSSSDPRFSDTSSVESAIEAKRKILCRMFSSDWPGEAV